ncbi:MAG: hypothetical protein ACI9SJ_000116 [Flavobacteriaceae bacterium]|jgi:hypothetical protein|uniref:SusD/RagB family nutrient-binding outer membrane lipoprotein n=1 Tax=Candidatus Marifrigoribacter sp. Uisw_064 TaxID=3230970 RepID=UPI003AD808EB
MKKINIISIFVFLILGVSFTSCETVDLDLLDDPNNVTTDKAVLERYMVAIQVDFGKFAEAMGRNGSQLTRLEHLFATSYNNAFDPSSTNFEWGLAYEGMFSDMVAANGLAESIEGFKHQGILKVLKAYTLITLVDYFGDVPFSEANNPAEFPAPSVDDDAAVYQAALLMLNEAIDLFGTDALGIENDLFYNNDFDKWINLANTLKMTAYLNTRLVDADATSKFNAIVNAGNFISSNDGDFQFTYSTEIFVIDESTTNDTRHPAYQSDYNVGGAGRYRANWLMDEMLNDNDPRIRYYFFRQNDCTPSATGCPVDPVSLFCSTESPPAHYPGSMIFCAVDNGYWGRDHGFAGGIPPDSFSRTASGVYPSAGNFDDDRFSSVVLGAGGAGAGMTPIVLASWVDLMRAEMALANGSVGNANGFMQAGMQKSISKVMSFGSIDPDGDLSFAPSSADVAAYISAKGDAFVNAPTANDRWELLSIQYLVAHFGNGSNAYNFYRRTGFPTSLQFNIEQSPGNFVRSFFYPADEANTNINIQQKPNVDQQVFWDNNPSSPGFPSAN